MSQIQYPHPEVHIVDWMAGVEWERERILNLRKQIINCVVDYGLAGETYLRAMRDLEALIKGEQK